MFSQGRFIHVVAATLLTLLILEISPILSHPLSSSSRICGSGYLYVNQTRKCYGAFTKGPCGELMVLRPTLGNPNVGECQCAVSNHPNEDSTCPSRPKVYWKKENRCFYLFDQGPCKIGQWLVVNGNGSPKCEKIPCLKVYNAQMKQEDYSVGGNIFVFAHEGKCYTTHGEGQWNCRAYEEVYFNDASFSPKCSGYFTCSSMGGPDPRRFRTCPDGSSPDVQGGCEPLL